MLYNRLYTMCVCIYICIYIYVCVYIYIYIYIYIKKTRWLQKWEENKSKVLINLCVCVKNSELWVCFPRGGDVGLA